MNRTNLPVIISLLFAAAFVAFVEPQAAAPVSYTHLTLPTILRV